MTLTQRFFLCKSTPMEGIVTVEVIENYFVLSTDSTTISILLFLFASDMFRNKR